MYNDEFELTFDLADAGPKKEQRRPTLPEPEPAAEPQSTAPAAKDRTVLISGGDRGIGAAAARAFYAAGYRVAVFYHTNAEAAAALQKELPGVLAVQCDVASRASCELAFRAAEQAQMPLKKKVMKPTFRRRVFFCSIRFLFPFFLFRPHLAVSALYPIPL